MIYRIFKSLNKNFEILDVLQQKNTARCPQSIIVKVDNEKKLVIIAKTPIQQFYLKRSIEKQKEFYEDFSKYFKFNFPDLYDDLDDFSYAIYPYIENLQWTTDYRPVNIINHLYEENAKIYQMNKELLSKIEEDFLFSWPHEYHERIKQADLYKEYFEKIGQLKEAKIYKEHCDYTVNNILTNGKDIYLMDFEFAKSFQIVGFDEYDYKRTLAIKQKKYVELQKLKVDLIDFINDIIDKSFEPKITIIQEEKQKYAKQVYPNFIYNRFDLRFGDDFDIFKVEENNKTFYIPYHVENDLAILGVWLTPISKMILDKLIKQIFSLHKRVCKIQIRYSLNTYDGLIMTNHWRVKLPETKEDFDVLLSANTRRNTKRKPKKIITEFGEYTILHYDKDKINIDFVQKYLNFKYQTLGVDYKLNNPMDFLKQYYVTDCYVLYIKNQISSVAFFANTEVYSYFENFSYDKNFAAYSLGDVIYYYAICDLISKKYKYIYLGDGWQDFKFCYNGINQLAFDGYVTRKKQTLFDKVKNFFVFKRR